MIYKTYRCLCSLNACWFFTLFFLPVRNILFFWFIVNTNFISLPVCVSILMKLGRCVGSKTYRSMDYVNFMAHIVSFKWSIHLSWLLWNKFWWNLVDDVLEVRFNEFCQHFMKIMVHGTYSVVQVKHPLTLELQQCLSKNDFSFWTNNSLTNYFYQHLWKLLTFVTIC